MIDIELAYEDVRSFLESHGYPTKPRLIVAREGADWLVTIISDPYPNEYFGTLAPKRDRHKTQTGLWYVLEGPAEPPDSALKALAHDARSDPPIRRQYSSGAASTIQGAYSVALANLKKEFSK